MEEATFPTSPYYQSLAPESSQKALPFNELHQTRSRNSRRFANQE
jgi:hypothetical protein